MKAAVSSTRGTVLQQLERNSCPVGHGVLPPVGDNDWQPLSRNLTLKLPKALNMIS